MDSIPHPGEDAPSDIHFPQGLPGFPGESGYRLERLSGTERFLRLRSELENGPGFLVLPNPPEGSLLEQADVTSACAGAGLDPAGVIVLFVATASRDASGLRLFVNRRAPVLVDAQRKLGFQVVLPRPDYEVRHALVA